MKMELKVTYTNGEELEVIAVVPDFIAWERHSKRKMSDLTNGIGMEDLAYLAWSVVNRTTKAKPFEGWINEVELIEPVENDPKATK
jgi:hypothetical protein